MSKSELKMGETYMLNSGGPAMTVVGVPRDYNSRVCFGWFDENTTYHTEWFHENAVKKVEGKKP